MYEFSSVFHALVSHANTIPDNIAIVEAEKDKKCTYSELLAYIKAFAQRLSSAGVKRDFGDGYGTRVVVRCTQTIDYIVSALAIHYAGGVFVPVEKNIPEMRIIEIMEETDSKILIAAKPLNNYYYTYIPLSSATDVNDLMKDALEESIIFPESDSLANILFTTGTTGKSKGVMHSQKSFTAKIHYLCSVFDHSNDQTYLIPSPLSHGNGFHRTINAIYNKCMVVLLDGYIIAKSFFYAISKYNVTYINLLSTAIEMYLRICRDKLIEISEQIEYISLGGSSFPETQIAALREIFPKSKIIQTYGATEINGCSVDYSNKKYTTNCIGLPYPYAKMVFFDEEKETIFEADRNNPGLFAFNSPSKMLGYWKNPELTESVTRGEYILLSDLGYKGEDGLFYILGRADDVIISGGYKIAPLEIEDVANSFVGIRESACIPVSDPIMGQVPKLYVVMEENCVFNFNDIFNFLKGKLEVTRLPRDIVEIDEIPKINNKINRKILKNK